MISKISPSFFEITVAMAFQYFADNKVDIAVIETGLGGRLDSTNVITPEISVITNIGWDHMNLLGDTLEAIAGEKAGIIKKEVPVVIGETQAETKQVFLKKAYTENAPISFADHARYAANWQYEHQLLHLDIMENANQQIIQYKLDLSGYYQAKNLVTVLEVVKQLQKKGWKLSPEDIHQGLELTKKITGLHGRWETIHLHPQVILDVAHNEAGMQQIVAQLELMQFKNLHIIIGMVKDKDVDKVLSLLPHNARYYFTRAQIPRAMPENILAEKAKAFNLTGKHYRDVHEALTDALQHSVKEDLILVCGSVFLIGEVEPEKIKGH